MPKIFYSTSDINNFILSQNVVPYDFENCGYIKSQYKTIIEQTQSFIQDFIDNKIEIAPQDISLVEDLVYDLRRVMPRKNHPVVKQYLHKISELKKIAKQKEHRLQSLQSLSVIESALNSKNKSHQLDIAELMAIQHTLQHTHNNKKVLRLEQQLQNQAQSKYIELKITDSFNSKNPFHTEFEKHFNLKGKPINPKQVASIQQRLKAKSKKTTASPLSFTDKVKASVKRFGQKASLFAHKTYAAAHQAFRKSKDWIFIGFIASASLMLGKVIHKELNYEYIPPSHPKMENTKAARAEVQDTTNTKDFQQALAEQKNSVKTPTSNTPKTSEVKVAPTNTKTSASTSPNQTQLSGDYYDTSLEIHLKSKAKVAALYHKIDSLAAKGLIKFSNGTNTKWYAHAATMYQLIRPNSQENKDFQNLLNGKSVDASYINNLVIKAGPKGQGVKPDNNSITTSNFDRASSQLQMQHLHNLQAQR